MDASIAIRPVFERFQSVVITSGVSALQSCCKVYCDSFVADTLSIRHVPKDPQFPPSYNGHIYHDSLSSMFLSFGEIYC